MALEEEQEQWSPPSKRQRTLFDEHAEIDDNYAINRPALSTIKWRAESIIKHGEMLFSQMDVENVDVRPSERFDPKQNFLHVLKENSFRWPEDRRGIWPESEVREMIDSMKHVSSEALRLILCAKFKWMTKSLYQSRLCVSTRTLTPVYDKTALVSMFLTTYGYPATNVPYGLTLLDDLGYGQSNCSKYRMSCYGKCLSHIGALDWFYNASRIGRSQSELHVNTTDGIARLFEVMLMTYNNEQIGNHCYSHFNLPGNTIRQMNRDRSNEPIAPYKLFRRFRGTIMNHVHHREHVPWEYLGVRKDVPIDMNFTGFAPIEYNEGAKYLEYPANVLWLHSVATTANYPGTMRQKPRSVKMKEKMLCDLRMHFWLLNKNEEGPLTMLNGSVIRENHDDGRIHSSPPANSAKRKRCDGVDSEKEGGIDKRCVGENDPFRHCESWDLSINGID